MLNSSLFNFSITLIACLRSFFIPIPEREEIQTTSLAPFFLKFSAISIFNSSIKASHLVSTVIQYLLTKPYDISTATIVSTTPITPQVGLPHAIEFKSDGTMMYVMDNQNKRVEQFTLSEAWNSATLSHDNFFAVTNETQIRGLAFKPDGTIMYVIGAQKEIIYKYSRVARR